MGVRGSFRPISAFQVAGYLWVIDDSPMSERGADESIDELASVTPLTSLTVAAVARRLGVAPATLRTWDRRYGLGPSGHQQGSHRRYNDEDLARLATMRRLIIAGHAPAQAAAMALAQEPSAGASLSDLASGISRKSSQASWSGVGDQACQLRIDQLKRGAFAMDRGLVESEISEVIGTLGVGDAWSNVLVPLLKAIGEDWAKSGKGIEVEHMLSEIIVRAFAEVSRTARQPINSAPVLLACVGEEIHSLAINALAACLAQDAIAVQYLGARTPQVAINETVRRSAPPAIFLWAQLASNANRAFIDELPAVRPAPRVILGGPGWSDVVCERAYVAHDLSSARQEIARAVGILNH